MSLGLTRTSAVALSPLVEGDDLTPEQAVAWLRAVAIDRLDVAALVRKEAAEIVELTAAAAPPA
jgi:hypothetical protein